MNIQGVEIVSSADVPMGTGVGSSSSFTVGLLHTIYSNKGKFVSKERHASEACEIEIEKLGNAASVCRGIWWAQFKNSEKTEALSLSRS